MYAWREFASTGGLISYGASLADVISPARHLCRKILNGAKPADLFKQMIASGGVTFPEACASAYSVSKAGEPILLTAGIARHMLPS
jgi:hypothetical protein